MRFTKKCPPSGRNRARSAPSAVLVLFAVLALLLSACAGSGGPEQTQATGTGEVGKDTSGTVRILMENVPDTDIVKSMVADFNKTYPDVKVDIESLTYDQMRDKLVSSFQSSSPNYDLIVVDNPWMVDFANAKFLQPLDARIDSTPDYDAGDFFKPLTDITTVDGVRCGSCLNVGSCFPFSIMPLF